MFHCVLNAAVVAVTVELSVIQLNIQKWMCESSRLVLVCNIETVCGLEIWKFYYVWIIEMKHDSGYTDRKNSNDSFAQNAVDLLH